MLNHTNGLFSSGTSGLCHKTCSTCFVQRNEDLFNIWGRGSSAVERATPGEEVPGSIPAVTARSLLVGSVSV